MALTVTVDDRTPLEVIRGRDQWNRYVTVNLYGKDDAWLDSLPATEANVEKVSYAVEQLKLQGGGRLAYSATFDRPKNWS